MRELRRVLVLYVDRDDDLGQRTGLRAPIIGREENLKAAELFALKAPEDSDVNALFAAIQLYDQLRESGTECEIATVTGSPKGGIEADLRVREQLEEVLKRFNADGVILVSDGATDEFVIPIVQSRVPVISVRRVIVQQSRGVEETYVVVIRYLKMLLTDPHYKRVALGLPGVLLLALAILASLNLLQYARIAIAMLAGIAMVVKGFSLDERAGVYYSRLVHLWESEPIALFSYIVAGITAFAGLYVGLASAMKYLPQGVTHALGMLLLAPRPDSLFHAVDLFIVSAFVVAGGRLLSRWLTSNVFDWRYLVSLVFIGMSRQLLVELGLLMLDRGSIILLLYWTGITVAASASLTIIFVIRERLMRWAKAEERARGPQ